MMAPSKVRILRRAARGRHCLQPCVIGRQCWVLPVINATIRADNVPGLAYYAKMGFREYKVDADVHLARGQVPRGGQQIQ